MFVHLVQVPGLLSLPQPIQSTWRTLLSCPEILCFSSSHRTWESLLPTQHALSLSTKSPSSHGNQASKETAGCPLLSIKPLWGREVPKALPRWLYCTFLVYPWGQIRDQQALHSACSDFSWGKITERERPKKRRDEHPYFNYYLPELL